MRGLSIRWRLTLWYGAVLSAILIGFSVAVYLLMQRHLLALTDASLREELDELAAEVKRVKTAGGVAPHARFAVSRPRGLRAAGRNALMASRCFRSVGIGSTGLPKPVPAQIGSMQPIL